MADGHPCEEMVACKITPHSRKPQQYFTQTDIPRMMWQLFDICIVSAHTESLRASSHVANLVIDWR